MEHPGATNPLPYMSVLSVVHYYFDIISLSTSLFAKLISGRHLFSLAHAASGYHKVLEENRKLYNQVQDLKGMLVSINFYTQFLIQLRKILVH